MAALQPAVQPALSGSAWSLGQNDGAQQIGTEGRNASDVGIPYADPNYGTGPLLQAPVFPAAAIESSGIDYLGVEYQGQYADQTPWPYYQGDPDRPANGATAEHGADWDSGNPAAIRWTGNPDIGQPVIQEFGTQSTDQQPLFSPNGQMVELAGSRSAPNMNWFNNDNVNQGIGYYIQESERPFYNQIAEVPGEFGAPGGQDQPDARYSAWLYNDGGIPPSFTTPPDAPVNPNPAQTPYVADDLGYVLQSRFSAVWRRWRSA
jgi:hypothetical protein